MAESAFGSSELRIWDLEEPSTARQIATLELDATSVTPLAVVYPILYVESGKAGSASSLAAIDISDPQAPVPVGQSDLSGGIEYEEFQVRDSRAMILMNGNVHLYEMALPRLSDVAYQSWQEESFPGETSCLVVAPEADPDRDGVSNWIEFALGSRPLRPDPSPVTVSLLDDKAYVAYNRHARVAQ